MDRCPDEILHDIFVLACTDDGTTGRRLSITSRRIRRVASAVRYRYIAVFGAAQLKAISVLLEAGPPSIRVEHLLVSLKPQQHRVTETVSSISVSNGTSSEDGDEDDTTDEDGDCRKKELMADTALAAMLQVISPTLRTLFIDGGLLVRYLHSISLPHLSALSIATLPNCMQDQDPSSIITPALLRLYVTSFFTVTVSRWSLGGIWDGIVCLVEADARSTLTHLRLSGVQFGNLAQYFRIQLDVPTMPVSPMLTGGELVHLESWSGANRESIHGSEEHAQATRLAAQLPALKNVWVEPRRYVLRGGCGTNMLAHGTAVIGLHAVGRQSQQLAEEKGNGGRLMMLPICDGEYELAQLLDDWLDYVGGGEGPWSHRMTTNEVTAG
jgi:hypothetical protein